MNVDGFNQNGNGQATGLFSGLVYGGHLTIAIVTELDYSD